MANDLFYVWKGTKQRTSNELELNFGSIFTNPKFTEQWSDKSCYPEGLGGGTQFNFGTLDGFFNTGSLKTEEKIVTKNVVFSYETPYQHPGGGMGLETHYCSNYNNPEFEKVPLRPSLMQHIFDEWQKVEQLENAAVYNQTENFIFVEGETGINIPNLWGTRVRQDNVQVLNNAGVPYATLNKGDYVFFTFGTSTLSGNSLKGHVGVYGFARKQSWAINEENLAASYHHNEIQTDTRDTIYGPSVKYLYVDLGINKVQEAFDWKNLNISVMPYENGLTE